MQGVLHVGWRVSPLAFPRVWRHCDHCKEHRPFDCSGKFRINAQKKRLDVWLIYHCRRCGRTWNCPIHERCRFENIGSARFQAFSENAPELVRHHAHDVAHLRRHAGHVEPASDIAVEKVVQSGAQQDAGLLVVTLALAAPCELRLERLLARELALSRSRLRALHEAELLSFSPSGRAPLRQGLRDGQQVVLRLDRLASLSAQVLRAACGCAGGG